MPFIAVDHVSLAFGHLPLLDDVSVMIERGERIAVIGRNGAGKSTLLQLLDGSLPPDRGSIWREPGTRTARLVQDVPLSDARTVFDVVADGLGDLRDLVRNYHRAVVDVTNAATPAAMTELGRAQHALEERDGWRVEQRVELVLSRLDLRADVRVDTLSGGWRRRVLLARALVSAPDILLLDEPTNHLDIEAIEWLETFLTEYTGALAFVTHDRVFLQRLATRIVEIDRGRLTSWPGSYAAFIEKRDAWLESESIAEEKFDKKLAQEEVWLRRGVKARRTRDEGRVQVLMAMREARAARRQDVGTVRLQIDPSERSGQLVFEADDISKSYGSTPVVSHFSTRVIRGDRIGLIGPNGAGKTTLLRLLVGDLQPDSGEVRHGANVQIAYFDQQREQLDPERTVVDTIGDGNDTVTVGGQQRHVHSYLRDFLFPAERAHSPVKALSGGERNRLLLARLLTRPANVLVLDEPTNDLDLETLELLEMQLVQFAGTLVIVSHDRQFLDNVVTSTMVFEGGGRIQEFVGGYEDWVRQRASERRPVASSAPQAVASAPKPTPQKKQKLSYRERQELAELPARIEALESETTELQTKVAAPGFYKESAETIKRTLARVDEVKRDLEAVYARWGELDSRA